MGQPEAEKNLIPFANSLHFQFNPPRPWGHPSQEGMAISKVLFA